MANNASTTVSLELTINEAEQVAAVLGSHIDLLNRLKGMSHASEAERTLWHMQGQIAEGIWGRLLRLW